MKKLFIIALSVLLVFSCTQVQAESSATAFSGKRYEEMEVHVVAYNNGSTAISDNSAVIIDVTGTAGSTLGAYIEEVATADSVYAFGVAGEDIAIGSVGKVVVKGARQLHVVGSGVGIIAGDLLATSSVAAGLVQEYSTADATAGGVIGVALAAPSGGRVWCWVNPQVHK